MWGDWLLALIRREAAFAPRIAVHEDGDMLTVTLSFSPAVDAREVHVATDGIGLWIRVRQSAETRAEHASGSVIRRIEAADYSMVYPLPAEVIPSSLVKRIEGQTVRLTLQKRDGN